MSQKSKFLQEELIEIVQIINIARIRVKLIRRVVSEISGRPAYERKIMELLKQSHSNAQKKAYKLAKKRLGTHKRALKKRNELSDAIARARQ